MRSRLRSLFSRAKRSNSAATSRRSPRPPRMSRSGWKSLGMKRIRTMSGTLLLHIRTFETEDILGVAELLRADIRRRVVSHEDPGQHPLPASHVFDDFRNPAADELYLRARLELH